jgi:hypothetical protein
VSEARTLWEEGHEPGRQVVALGLALTLTACCLDLLVGGHVGLLFDVMFVPVCVAVALLVRPEDFFTVGVLPPLMMLAVFAVLGLTRPGSIAHSSDGFIQAVVSGLSTHAVSLGVGYSLCLGCLYVRDRVLHAQIGPASPRRWSS